MLKAKSRISACILCAPWSLPSLHLSCWRAFKVPCIFCYTKEKFSVLFSVWVRGISGFALYWQKTRGEKWLQHGPAGESKCSWTNEREARVAVNQVDKKESAHLLVILQGSSVCPALSAFLLSVHYRELAAQYSHFLLFSKRVHMSRYFQSQTCQQRISLHGKQQKESHIGQLGCSAHHKKNCIKILT